MTYPDWRVKRNFFRTAKNKCVVCGSAEKIGIEPRYGYSVCEEHSKIPPAQLDKYKPKTL